MATRQRIRSWLADEWEPGMALYHRPNYGADGQFIRSIIQEIYESHDEKWQGAMTYPDPSLAYFEWLGGDGFSSGS